MVMNSCMSWERLSRNCLFFCENLMSYEECHDLIEDDVIHLADTDCNGVLMIIYVESDGCLS